MRVRKKKNGEVRLAACAAVLLPVNRTAPAPLDLRTVFPNAEAFYLEIGCGKGTFITQIAAQNPTVACVAVERISDVLLLAAEKAAESGLPNLRFLGCDAEILPILFPEKLFSHIFINFCDPWPKARHAKRRLTCRASLEHIKTYLKDDGVIAFKTDNSDLFAYSLDEFRAAGFTLRAVTDDLHASEWAQGNIMTEYEANFSAKGYPIHRLEAVPEKI